MNEDATPLPLLDVAPMAEMDHLLPPHPAPVPPPTRSGAGWGAGGAREIGGPSRTSGPAHGLRHRDVCRPVEAVVVGWLEGCCFGPIGCIAIAT